MTQVKRKDRLFYYTLFILFGKYTHSLSGWELDEKLDATLMSVCYSYEWIKYFFSPVYSELTLTSKAERAAKHPFIFWNS